MGDRRGARVRSLLPLTRDVDDLGIESLVAIDASSALYKRAHQMYPRLERDEIERLRHFGRARRYRRGERLFSAGEPGPGMIVIESGRVTINLRDGMGRVTPTVRLGPGHFLAEIASLSGAPALVDGDAADDVTGYVIEPEQVRALMIAEAELGERIMRALILRRVGLIERGATGPVLIGDPASARLLELRTFLERNGQPHATLDPTQDDEAATIVRQLAASASDTVALTSTGHPLVNPTIDALARALGMVDTHECTEIADVIVVGAGPAASRRPCTPRRKACTSSCSTAAPTAGRPARARASRITSASRPASRAARSPAARSCRRRSSAPKC